MPNDLGATRRTSDGDLAASASVSRRMFLKAGAAIGGGLLLEFVLPGTSIAQQPSQRPFAPNAFVRIDRAGRVTLVVHKVEMGQGTYTSMPMLVAEELEVDLRAVQLEHAPPDDKAYGDALNGGAQVTGASTSVRAAWEPLRRAGATARTMLVTAAAQRWNVRPESCRAENGAVIHTPTRRRLRYGQLVDAAARLAVPTSVTLKDPKDFRLIGTPARRLDTPDKVNGKAMFGIDVRLPGMRIATVAASPVFGGTLAQVDESQALAIAGVRQVVRLDNAVAVVADGYWAAKSGLSALKLTWDDGPHANVSTADIVADMETASERTGTVARREGDFATALTGAAIKVQATYQVPFLAHATMEPMNCTVHLRRDRCDIWVGTQVPTFVQAAAAQVAGLSKERVTVHNHLLGGGFGRRLEVDCIVQAVQIAKQVEGPVKVIWPREEDIQHDVYRPYYYDRLAAGLDAEGRPVAWMHRIVGSSILSRFFPPAVQNGVDPDAVDGAAEIQYAIPNVLVEYVRHEPPGIPTGFWRGVGVTHNVFVVESFIDELAASARRDPFEFRRDLLSRAPRAKAVLELAAAKAGWGAALPAGTGRGISIQYAFGSYMAQVVEVSVSPSGDVRVTRVVCAVDCGIVVNPDTVRAQIESGVIFGITAALYGEITIKDGRVEQSNFHDYRMLRINETPAIEVHITKSSESPGGIGEPGTSALAPALTNAIYSATGTRLRKLPVDSSQLRTA